MMSTTMKRRRGSARTATVACATLVAALTMADAALAQQIVVQGNSRVDAETIRSYVTGTGSGSLEEARRNLLATGMFSDVRVGRSGGNVVVTVRENTTINRVVFEGSTKIKKEVLEGEVQAKARGPLSQAILDADVARLREIFRRTGRGSATITARVVDLPNGRVDVVYTIDEGGKTGIKEIRFIGNQAVSSYRLRELMTSSEMNLLSFLKTNDIYDPDRIDTDLELIRRYYLKHGYADFRVLSTDAQFDAARGGYIVTIALEEGPQYRVGDVRLDTRLPDIDPELLRGSIETRPGEVYNAEGVEKSLTRMTTEAARRGYIFAQVRPTGQRDPATQTVSIGYVVEEGPRVYIERVNVRGNTRTRDYVIRRELDLGEGDAYNKVLIDRAERRLNGLGYFKKVRISNEPGSAPDRVVVNIDVEDQPTGAFSVAGGYSTADGFIGEVSVSESNFLGRGQFVKLAGSFGQYAQGVDFSFTEPYFLGYRLAAGIDLFSKFSDQTKYARYENRTTGGQLRLGFPITEEIGITLRYALYQSELKIPNTIKKPFNDCTLPIAGYTAVNADGTPLYPNCAYDGEASIAVKESTGKTLTSLAGLTIGYNGVDNLRNPHNGLFVEVKPEVAGLGGDSKFFRVTGDLRYYHELFIEDIVGVARLQGGHIQGLGRTTSNQGITTFGGDVRLTDHFFLGPTLVRGFAPSGFGPRDISIADSTSNSIGGTTYYGGSLEAQFPIWGLPRELGLKGAVFADAGTLFGYKGPRGFDVNANGLLEGFEPCTVPAFTAATATTPARSVQPECIQVRDKNVIRSSVGASILWNSPLGPLRFDYAIALSKDEGYIDPTTGVRVGKDKTQAFRFSGGTRF
jgi:outer membrane protein insertion porin family